ncbi:MAG: S46 family peptidase [Planctomycetota bacterium]
MAALAALLALSAQTHAQAAPHNGPAAVRTELGKMWLFENPPLAYLRDEYGFAPTQEWLQALRLASLRFGNWCSASFVSPRGLILTNHHCVRDNVADASSEDRDLVESGYYAHSLEDELPLPGLYVSQLVAIEDVTDAVLAGTADASDPGRVEQRRRANEQSILDDAATRHPDLAPEIVTLHQGAAFHLYLYKRYEDVRLVCAPPLQAAHFGGDPDNFTYPRYCMDFAFCRAWEDGRPADTTNHHFSWSGRGAQDGEVVFVTGNPGSTGRLLTHAQLVYLRDAQYPLELQLLKRRLDILRAFVQQFPPLEPALRNIILGDENSLKATQGYYRGLIEPQLMARKRAFEAEFRAAVAADPKLAAKYGDAWQALAEISAAKTALEAPLQFHSPAYSAHLTRALAIVRAVDPRGSETERATARELVPAIQVQVSPLQQALFIDHLQRATKWLERDDPYLVALVGDSSPEAGAIRIAQSRVGEDDVAQELLAGGMAAVEASADPAIVAARVIAPLADANDAAARRLEEAEAVQARRIGRAIFAVFGDRVSPDATMTLRFSDGRVQGYAYNGTQAPWRTTFWGLYGRHNDFDGRQPFDLPEPWLAQQNRVDLGAAVNFVSTNDIIGGNSGSPVVNRDLQVVGLIFDGNIEQLPNRFLYRDRSQRSVSVHTDGITETLAKILDATPLLQELGGVSDGR